MPAANIFITQKIRPFKTCFIAQNRSRSSVFHNSSISRFIEQGIQPVRFPASHPSTNLPNFPSPNCSTACPVHFHSPIYVAQQPPLPPSMITSRDLPPVIASPFQLRALYSARVCDLYLIIEQISVHLLWAHFIL